jgi:hypothetical protein
MSACHVLGQGGAYVHAYDGGRIQVDAFSGHGCVQPPSECHVVGCGTHTCALMIRGADKGAHGSWEEGIFGLPSSLEVAKSSPCGSLPSTCIVFCLELVRLEDLAHQT